MGGEEAEASTAPGTSRRERLGVPHSSCQHEFGPGLSVQIHVCNFQLQATFVKPSTNFTDCLPSFFALLSGLWLKTDAGPRNGQHQKMVRRQTEITYPDAALLRPQGNRRIKNSRHRSGPESRLRCVED